MNYLLKTLLTSLQRITFQEGINLYQMRLSVARERIFRSTSRIEQQNNLKAQRHYPGFLLTLTENIAFTEFEDKSGGNKKHAL